MKKKKAMAPWQVFLRSSLLTLAGYLMGLLLLALLLVEDVLPEAGMYPAVAVLCLLATLMGGLTLGRDAPWGRLPSELLHIALVSLLLIALGAGCWQSGFAERGWGLLLCVLAGGVLSALLAGGKGRHRKKSNR